MALLEIVKRQLGYLNADENVDLLLQDLLDEGKSFLSPYCADLDFDSPTLERTLLINFVRYGLSNATDDFSKNYKDQILRLSNRGKVKSYADSQKE